MKSEIDVGSEIERQRRLREAEQKDRLLKSIPPSAASDKHIPVILLRGDNAGWAARR